MSDEHTPLRIMIVIAAVILLLNVINLKRQAGGDRPYDADLAADEHRANNW